MELIVENGMGLELANSYLDVALADELAEFYQEIDWAAASDEAKAAALVKGARFIDAVYGARFIGSPTQLRQGLAWPRVGAFYNGRPVVASNEVPARVKEAAALAAYRALKSPLLPDTETGVEEIQVGPIRKKVGPAGTSRGYPELTAALRPYLAAAAAGTFRVEV